VPDSASSCQRIGKKPELFCNVREHRDCDCASERDQNGERSFGPFSPFGVVVVAAIPLVGPGSRRRRWPL